MILVIINIISNTINLDSHFCFPHPLADGYWASSFGGYVFLQRQPPLGFNQLQPLAGFLVHHLEKGILQDGVQLFSSHLEFNCITKQLLWAFWISSIDLKNRLPWMSSSRITPKQKTTDFLVEMDPPRTSGERYSPSFLLFLLTMFVLNLTVNLSRCLTSKLWRIMLLGL